MVAGLQVNIKDLHMSALPSKLESLVEKYASDCVGFLQKLVQTPSVNGEHNEGEVAAVIQKQCTSLGLASKLYELEAGRPNVYVGLDNQFSDDQNTLFVAHADTVPVGDESKWGYPAFGGEIHDGKIYGRGALDCKGGIALAVYALKVLQELGVSDKAKLLVGVDEESGADSQFGIRHVLSQGLKARGVIYTYGGRAGDSLTIGHRGVLRVWVTCHGELAHSGSREWQDGVRGASAIDGIRRFLDKITEYGNAIAAQSHEYFKGYRCVITSTLLEGGSGESLVPDRVRVLLDIRTLPGQTNENIFSDLKKIADGLAKDKIRYELEIKNNIQAAFSDPDSPFIASVKSTMQDVYGYGSVSLKGSGPANESWMLIASGIPTVVGFGPTGEGFHSRDEYADISSFERSLRFLVSVAIQA